MIIAHPIRIEITTQATFQFFLFVRLFLLFSLFHCYNSLLWKFALKSRKKQFTTDKILEVIQPIVRCDYETNKVKVDLFLLLTFQQALNESVQRHECNSQPNAAL